jgi:predicted GNAT superfamily acetyltransferase
VESPPGDHGPAASEAQIDVDVRPLATLDEYRACVALQRATWGEDFSEVVPLSLLKVCQRIGGVTAGAFDEHGALLGFVFGLTGVDDDGRLIHWSDMLAVRRGYRNHGLGRRLKVYQREVLRALGVETIYWTFDPLVARNAHLNVNRLRARIVEYVPDMYGTTDSPLHRGLGTDRFIVAWPIAGTGGDAPPGATAPLAGAGEGAGESEPIEAPLVNPVPAGEPSTLVIDAAERRAPRVRVQVPLDIQKVQDSSLEQAAAWRRNTRASFLVLHDLGYQVVGFQRGDTSGPCGYLLAPTGDSVA